MYRFSLRTASIAIAALAIFASQTAAQSSGWTEGFEGPERSWVPAGGNAQHQFLFHQRMRSEAHRGESCERVQLSGSGGSAVYLAHDVGQAQLIDDLLPTIWIKADRPGIQLLAQVVLKRTLDPRTGQPVSILLQGSAYTMVGRWQQLKIEEINKRLLTRETWVLRTQYGPSVDPREAYVARLLLNVYGGPGVTNVWIDDLEVAGYVGPPGGRAEQTLPVASSNWTPGAVADRVGQSAEATAGIIKLVDSVLTVDNQPIFPRLLQYQGERLEFVKSLGFNGVWLSRPPTAELLEEAQQEGLWLVCAPPQRPQSESPDQPPPPISEIGPAFDRVLAWDLGQGLGKGQLDLVRLWAEQVKTADRRQSGRPLVCQPETELKNYSRIIQPGFLILSRSPLGTSMELSQYSEWLRERPRLARAGTPMWTTIQTQPSESQRRQWAAIGLGAAPTTVAPEQVELLAYMAVVAGSRGLLFESSSPLDRQDAETRLRAMSLELVNRQMEWAEPWAAAGHLLASFAAREQGVVAGELHREHGRLVIPLWSTPRSQYVTGQCAARDVLLTIPGVPETSSAYLLSPGGLKTLRSRRAAGGYQATLDEFGVAAQVLLTSEPKTIQEFSRRVTRAGPRIAQLQCDLVAAKAQAIDDVLRAIAGRAPPAPQAEYLRSRAKKELEQARETLAAGHAEPAWLHAQRAAQSLRLVEQSQWDAVVGSFDSPVASPGAVSFATLPAHFELLARVAKGRLGSNLLPGGDFEQPSLMFQEGWQRFRHSTEGVADQADLARVAAQSGQLGLRLSAEPSDPERVPAQIESPPTWMTTAPVQARQGEVVRIAGKVRIAKTIQGSADGLLVVDSFGGEALAERFRAPAGWRSFTFYRVATETGPLTVSFVLTGLGEAWIDDVSVQVLQETQASAAQHVTGTR